VFIVFMTTVAGIEAINTQHVNIVRVMGAGRFGIMRKIVLPSALPFLITGLRLAIPEALIGAVIGEFIASDAGVGHLVDAAASQFNMAVSLAGIVVLLAIVAVSDGVLSVFERRVMRWSPAARIGHA
jgi:NitT/TauT family transport system permease protein